MYVLYKSKNILTLVTIGYIVGFVVGMYVEYSYGPKWPYWIYIAYIGLFGTGICRFIQVLYLGRAPRTKETLPDFREKCRVTRHSRVFRGLTGSQRTPGFWGVTIGVSNPSTRWVYFGILYTIWNILEFYKLFGILLLIYVVLFCIIVFFKF